MKSSFLVLALSIAAGAFAQGPAIGPGPAAEPYPPRGDLWQLLTPEQRDQLWRSLSPEQRSEVWRRLQPQERREMRERIAPGDPGDAGGPWAMRRRHQSGEAPPGRTMSPEERQQMREQIREAQRLRRERMEAERRGRAQ